MANRLIHATSPYLQQHADNPVDWQPWSEEAFAEAGQRDCPVLLSIGYSTCHWCHVMAHESFEDAEVAHVLNRHFVCIKLDREERPELDAIYMQAAQALTGSGGWPLNVLLTPDRRPFHAFTYLPKRSRFGRPGLIETAERIAELWTHERKRVERSAGELTDAVIGQSNWSLPGRADAQLADAAWGQLTRIFDAEYGGFGAAPKFPSPHQLLFLLRYGVLKEQSQAINMVVRTLDAMRKGGIHDQLGGGFHRYSTDAKWLVPHFEKMLYDQAMLLLAYSESWQVTHDDGFADTARGIADYLLRDMRDAGGAFYSAEDADSEGEEGKFYVWSEAEIDALLDEDAAAFKRAFGILPEGNFHDEATGRRSGTNILHLADTAAMPAERLSMAKAKLLTARGKRVRPFRDDKILADWNGLAIAALAAAGRILDVPAYIEAAATAARFVLERLRDDSGALLHSCRQGKAGGRAQLDDYACMVWGLLELYGATFEPEWLQSALQLNGAMLARFAAEEGGFYMAEASDELIVRPLTAFDGALPSGNSVAMHNLLRLARLTGDAAMESRAARLADRFAGLAGQVPVGLAHMLSALLVAAASGCEIVLSGDRQSADAAAMLEVLREKFRPTLSVVWREAVTEQLAPFLRDLPEAGSRVTASICEDFQCHLPVVDAAGLAGQLDSYVQH